MSWLDDLRAVLDGDSEIDSETAERVCTLIEQRWTGERVYIGRRRPRIDPRMTPREIASTHQVSLPTAYRWAVRWRR